MSRWEGRSSEARSRKTCLGQEFAPLAVQGSARNAIAPDRVIGRSTENHKGICIRESFCAKQSGGEEEDMSECSIGVRGACALAVLMITGNTKTKAGTTDPWADAVVDHNLGAGGVPDYTDPNSALGEPSRFTGDNAPFSGFDSAVTPFNPAFNIDQIVSLGEGGFITLEFDEPFTNDAANPYGIDLLIFGNAGFIDAAYPSGIVSPGGALFGVGGGTIEISADGSSFFPVSTLADELFPTLGYTDLTTPYETAPGVHYTDFTRPVDPAFNPSGLAYADLLTGYDGSGGGAGIDISSTGLNSARFVRISNPIGSGVTVEIDGVSDVAVPAPGSICAFVFGAWGSMRRVRRRHAA